MKNVLLASLFASLLSITAVHAEESAAPSEMKETTTKEVTMDKKDAKGKKHHSHKKTKKTVEKKAE